MFRGYRRGMSGDADIARISALIGEPSRARVLMALADGRALPAGVLAGEAGVSASTISEHLRRLLDAHLVAVERQGRTRRYRLAGPPVAEALEAIARIAPPEPVRSLRQGTHAHALRRARTCYNHLAGRLGVALMAALLRDGVLVGAAPSRPGGGPARRARPRRRVPADRRAARARSTALGVDLDALRGRRHAGPLLPGLVRAAPPPRGPARYRAHRPPVRPGLDPPHRPAARGPAQRRGPRRARAARRPRRLGRGRRR